jgi:hypothetical protein
MLFAALLDGPRKDPAMRTTVIAVQVTGISP